jgi:hypothetical protein
MKKAKRASAQQTLSPNLNSLLVGLICSCLFSIPVGAEEEVTLLSQEDRTQAFELEDQFG